MVSMLNLSDLCRLALGITTMSLKIQPPDLSKTTYERYVLELKAWEQVTDVAHKKRGVVVALSLPHSHDGVQIRDQVFDQMDLKELGAKGGLEKLISFMDTKLKVDDLADSL